MYWPLAVSYKAVPHPFFRLLVFRTPWPTLVTVWPPFFGSFSCLSVCTAGHWAISYLTTLTTHPFSGTTVAWTDDEAILEGNTRRRSSVFIHSSHLPVTEGLTCAGIDLTQKDDLPNFDLLRRFQLDVDGASVGVESIEGTDSVQAAYRLNKDSQFAVATRLSAT